jgi:hypothetical protein
MPCTLPLREGRNLRVRSTSEAVTHLRSANFGVGSIAIFNPTTKNRRYGSDFFGPPSKGGRSRVRGQLLQYPIVMARRAPARVARINKSGAKRAFFHRARDPGHPIFRNSVTVEGIGLNCLRIRIHLRVPRNGEPNARRSALARRVARSRRCAATVCGSRQ